MPVSPVHLRTPGRFTNVNRPPSEHLLDQNGVHDDHRGLQLPPGSMGGGPLGSIPEYRLDPAGFLWHQYNRYGPAFKTRLGRPTVFLIGPDANRFILHDHPELFS